MCEWFVFHFSPNFVLLAGGKTDRQTNIMDCVLIPLLCWCACGVTNLKARATYHSTIALVLASNEMSLQYRQAKKLKQGLICSV